MEEPCRVSFRDGRLASRKAEAGSLLFSSSASFFVLLAFFLCLLVVFFPLLSKACRRFQAAKWLDTLAGPLRLSPQPSEQEFVSCLRSGLILCNTINKIQPGAVPKVVANPSLGTAWDIQPLPAYQYFENVRNFLVAVEQLKLPSFEASDLERDTLEAGSAAKVVDCILALKSYHEWKQCNGGNGPWKLAKSPVVPQSVGRMQSHTISLSSVSCRHLDMSTTTEKQKSMQKDNQKSEDAMDSLMRVLSDYMFNSKEHINENLLKSWNQEVKDPIKLFSKIMSSCLEEQQHQKLWLGKGDSYHWNCLEAQESKLKELRTLLLRTRVEFITLQTQLQHDFAQLGVQIQGLSVAAHGYHQAVKENRQLYNTLQELRGNIRVFCRIRPIFNEEGKCTIDYIGNDGSLMVIDPFKPQNTCKIFQFNKVFGPTATQDEVYKDTQALIRSVMDGYNVCIFAYGQTGSGKTHTMCGPSNGSSKDIGINYMALNDLFQISSIREDNRTLEIRSCSNNVWLSLPDANMHLVQSTADVLNLMKLGEKNRTFGSTAMNHRSSRSHSVLTVHVHGKDISGGAIHSCLHLVDLAGSERVDKSEATGDRLKEAQHINKSLSCLGDVITALAQKNSHIPYRNSKLTQLLQNSLGGNAKMLMFAHVSPEADSYGETISTLKFAQRASTVELGAAHLNKESSEIRELKEQIDGLKNALAIKEGEKSISSQKMKENNPNLDRLKQFTERTPPRPRRLSTGNPTVLKNGTVNNLDERKVLKSPISRLKLPTDYAPIYNRRMSSEGSKVEKKQQELKTAASHIYSKFSAGKPLKENILCAQVAIQDCAVAKASMDNKNCCNIIATEAFHQCSPGTCNSACSQLPKVENRSRIHLHQKTSDPAAKLDEIVTTPDETSFVTKSQSRSSTINASSKGSHSRSSTINASSKGSHIRKSLQSIGKYIHGSERRNIQCQSKTPSKFAESNNFDVKSPMTADARLRRRQSLTNVQTLDPNDIQSARTPPIRSSPKAIKVVVASS
ncbi:Kinesin-like protein KIN-14A [Cocos nucifera]|uniref:Kinesin-like protein KIN-14A n=1 Tax=Cocos nucifera TaxID=13894 RepID=A0A8K0IXX7_COCNU|nr:Kinesin-like protein KIN-14A [Cocos nucifera]